MLITSQELVRSTSPSTQKAKTVTYATVSSETKNKNKKKVKSKSLSSLTKLPAINSNNRSKKAKRDVDQINKVYNEERALSKRIDDMCKQSFDFLPLSFLEDHKHNNVTQYRAAAAIFNVWIRVYYRLFQKSMNQWKKVISDIKLHEEMYYAAEKKKRLITFALYNLEDIALKCRLYTGFNRFVRQSMRLKKWIRRGAAIKIQCMVRKHLAVKYVNFLKIDNNVAKRDKRKNITKALLFEYVACRVNSRKVFRSILDKNATMIQRLYRGVLGRRIAKTHKEWMLEKKKIAEEKRILQRKCAIRIQSIWRGYIRKKKYKERLRRIAERKQKRLEACAVIQRVYRGHKGRKKYRKLLNKKLYRNKAAVTVYILYYYVIIYDVDTKTLSQLFIKKRIERSCNSETTDK